MTFRLSIVVLLLPGMYNVTTLLVLKLVVTNHSDSRLGAKGCGGGLADQKATRSLKDGRIYFHNLKQA